MHTSTVTVSVVDLDALPCDPDAAARAPADFEHVWYSGTGAGGQHRNKHQNSLRLRHIPTGIVVTAQCRKRPQSLDAAYRDMNARLDALGAGTAGGAARAITRAQEGSGERSDKRRTYRDQEGRITDHLTGKGGQMSLVKKGLLDRLW
mgnify:CR=1 FL=1